MVYGESRVGVHTVPTCHTGGVWKAISGGSDFFTLFSRVLKELCDVTFGNPSSDHFVCAFALPRRLSVAALQLNVVTAAVTLLKFSELLPV